MQQEGEDPTVVTGRLEGQPARLGPGSVGWLVTGREVSGAQRDDEGSVCAYQLAAPLKTGLGRKTAGFGPPWQLSSE